MNSNYARFLNPFSKSKKRYDCCESTRNCDPPPCADPCPLSCPPQPCIDTCPPPCPQPCCPPSCPQPCSQPCQQPCADPCDHCEPVCDSPCEIVCPQRPCKPCDSLPHPVRVRVVERVRNPYGGFGEGFQYPPCSNLYPDVYFKCSRNGRKPCTPRSCSRVRIVPQCQAPPPNNCMLGQPCAFPSYGMWNPAFSMGSAPNIRWF